MIPYHLRRSARARRLRITVGVAGIEVVAPLRMRAAYIMALVTLALAFWLIRTLGRKL